MSRSKLGLLPLLLLLGCAGHAGSAAVTPLHGQTAPPMRTAPSAANGWGLPPLPGPGSPLSAYRQISATSVQVQGSASTSSGGTGNANHVNANTHTLSLVPGGEDDLSFAVYSVPNLSTNRPVQLSVTASLLHPGGEDPLEYWVMVSDYSAGKWKLSAGPNADKSFSDASIVLNSATERERLVSPQQGATDPVFSFAIVTMGNASNSSGMPFDQQPRVEITLSTTDVLPQTDPAYFKTAPLPAQISGAEANLQAGSITLDLVTDPDDVPDRVDIERSVAGSNQWHALGSISGTGGLYVDPDDNSAPGATPPQPGQNYRYRAFAIAIDGANELRAWPSNEQAASLSTNLPPVADLTALPPLVNVGDSVTFNASSSVDPDGTITDYEWDFDGNGVFNEPGPELIAHGNPAPAPFTYASAGTYLAAVRVTDNGGASASTTKQVIVNAPPSAFILPDISDGPVPLLVNFDGTDSFDSDGTIADYEWDLDGNGVFNEPGNGEAAVHGSPAAQFTYGTAGVFHPSLRVTDNRGSQNTVSVPITVHGWTPVTVDSAGLVGAGPSLAVVNGKPALSYHDATNGQLKYALSSTADGANAADWTCISIAAADNTQQSTSLAVINGNPAIAYIDAASHGLFYAFSATTTGASPADWGTVQIDVIGNVDTEPSLTAVNGFPSIAYYDTTGLNLDYAYSTAPDGSDNWSSLVVDGFGTDMGNSPSLAVINAKPAISYEDTTNGHLKYAYSSTLDGSSGWNNLTVDSSPDVGLDTSLAEVNGFPAISYNDFTNLALKYAWSSAADGSSGWSSLQVDGGAGFVGLATSLAVINGFPAISYRDETNTSLKYAWSSASDGASGWNSFTVDSSGDNGYETSLRLVNGKPAIGYFDQGNNDLKYAYGP